MNTYKVTMKEELAIQQWQNVLAFGAQQEATELPPVQQQRKVTFQVLP